MHIPALAVRGLLASNGLMSPPRPGRHLNRRLEVDATNLNFVEPDPSTASPPPGETFVDCDITIDTNCSCVANTDGSLQYYCGWVDPSWTTGAVSGHWGRVLLDSDSDTNDSILVNETSPFNASVLADFANGIIDPIYFVNVSTPDDPGADSGYGIWGDGDGTAAATTIVGAATTTTPTDGGIASAAIASAAISPTIISFEPSTPAIPTGVPIDKRIRTSTGGPEINVRVRNPLLSVLKLMTFSLGKIGKLACILTRLPKEERGGFVQGIKGITEKPLTIVDNGVQYLFKAGARFEIRWDFSGVGANGQPAGNGMEGLHVNFAMDDGTTRQKWGYYEIPTVYWPSFTDTINLYSAVRNRLTQLAGYTPGATATTPGTFRYGEETGANIIANLWDGFVNPEL